MIHTTPDKPAASGGRSGRVLAEAGPEGARLGALGPIRALLLLSFAALLGCASSSERDDRIQAQLAAQLAAAPSGPVDLSLLGPAEWDRVCVLRPYPDNEDASSQLGFSWDAEGKTAIHSRDDACVLLFVRGNQVVAYTEQPRSIDLSELEPSCLPRAKALVLRRADADRVVLVAAPRLGLPGGPFGR